MTGKQLDRPRFYLDQPLHEGARFLLPEGVARHVQVLRLQPEALIVLFDGQGGQWRARIERMGRREVEVCVLAHEPIEREASRRVHLIVALMPHERLEWLLEKAVELGAASLTPVISARCKVRLAGAQAEKKRLRWQAIIAAASEQCGRNRLMTLQPLQVLSASLQEAAGSAAWLLSPDHQAQSLADAVCCLNPADELYLLSGPEGGLDASEQEQARAAGFVPVRLGSRILRAETAPLACLAAAVLLN